MIRLIVSRPARRDLNEIGQYTRGQWGAAQQAKYLSNIADRFHALLKNPQLGRPRDELGSGYRSLLVGSHIIFYKVTSKSLVILHILHQSMDPKLHL